MTHGPAEQLPRRAPDLLFEDEQSARVEDLASLIDHPERVDARTPLHRLTVFLTYRCNLSCPYCKTIARTPDELERFPQKRQQYDLASFEALLEGHRGTPIRHLHFTGGEASLVPQLAQMVRRARAAGIEAISMTSNGTLRPERYLELIQAGLDELRISLDADHAALGAQLTNRNHAFDAAARTLEALGNARRSGVRFTLIINTVVTLENRTRLPQMLRFFLRFSPDDVKLITEVELRGRLGDFPEAAQVRAELDEELKTQPAASLPLLRRKLDTVFAPHAIGLAQIGPRREGQRWRCYIPLTERTVDRVSYYPCSVYLREGGAPLGPLTDAPEVQRERSANFVRDSDCATDPICRRYCLHCTRAFNDRANEVRR